MNVFASRDTSYPRRSVHDRDSRAYGSSDIIECKRDVRRQGTKAAEWSPIKAGATQLAILWNQVKGDMPHKLDKDVNTALVCAPNKDRLISYLIEM
jgi:hypothetical protein